MIELFDAARLSPKRDHSLVLLALTLAAGAGALAVYAGQLQQQLRAESARKVQLEGQLRQAKARSNAPTGALIADLQRELQLAEGELAAARPRDGTIDANGDGTGEELPTPAAWLDRLAALGTPDLSLARVDVDARGGARIEGLATSAQAVSSFVQAFSRHEARVGLKPRAVELKQDKANAALLRFQLIASAPGQSVAAAAGPAAPAALPAASAAGPSAPAGVDAAAAAAALTTVAKAGGKT